MKKILLVLFIFCFSFAGNVNTVGLDGSVVSGGGCTTPQNGDELSEGFLGTGYENSWTESISGGTVNEDATLTGSWPTDACTEGLLTSGTGANNYSYWDRGTAIDPTATNTDITYLFRINSYTLSEGESFYISGFSTDSGSPVGGPYKLVLRVDTGNFQLYIIPADAITISTGTVYKLVISLNTTAASSSYTLTSWNGSGFDAVASNTFTRTDGLMQYLFAGLAAGVAGTEQAEIEWGGIWVNTP
jgi:hypothetical protein